MGLFDFMRTNRQITVEKIQDFYLYSDISKWIGNAGNAKNAFGSCIQIDNTRENGRYTYNGVWIFGDKKWAHISVANEAIQIRYLETDYMPLANSCHIVTDSRTINLITNAFFYWYGELNLPKAIEEVRKRVEAGDAVSVLKEIEIKVFGDEAVFRVMSDKRTYLIFNFFPPKKGYLTKQQADNFEKLLSEAIDKRVIHDDRETFVVFDDSQKMIEDTISFLQGFARK